MTNYNIVASTNESTVVAEYTAEQRTAADYQSEADLEREFIRLLSGQGYEVLAIHNEAVLIINLRRQLETLNVSHSQTANGRGSLMSVSQAQTRVLLKKPVKYRTTTFRY